MTPDLALLEAVRDRPEDDLPRLVYADWCDENGQPERAEFIRVQCELAKLSEDDPRRDALVKRQDELLSHHHAEWSGPLAAQYTDSVAFHRGFVDQIDLNLMLQNRGPVIRPLTGTLAVAAVTALSIWVDPRNPIVLQKVIDRMTGWPALRSIRSLRIKPGNRLSEQHLRQLFHNPHLSGAKEFRFDAYGVTAAELPLFATASFARQLSRFHARVHGNRGEWCRAWARLPFVPQLVELDMCWGEFEDSHLATFLTADMPQATAANLSNNELTDRAFDLLARWPGCERLTRLGIDHNRLGPHQFSRLIDLPLGQLRDLTVGQSFNPAHTVPIKQWRRLAESPLADHLTKLSVNMVRSDSPFARELCRATFRSLTELSLWYTPFDPPTLRALTTAQWFQQLRKVSLLQCELGDEHAEVLLRAEVRDRAFLELRSNQFSDAAKQKLRAHFGNRVQV